METLQRHIFITINLTSFYAKREKFLFRATKYIRRFSKRRIRYVHVDRMLAGFLPFLLTQVGHATPFPWGPPSQLPTLNGSAFPPFRTVFFQGECTANDLKGAINQNKTCFSCFRIPTVLAGQNGVLHAFAEARRGVRSHSACGGRPSSCCLTLSSRVHIGAHERVPPVHGQWRHKLSRRTRY